jgi:hypothetical protein
MAMPYIYLMKNKTIYLIGAGLMFLSSVAFVVTENILDRLGVEAAHADNAIQQYGLNNRFWIPRARNLAQIIQGDKITAAKEVCQYIKAYTQSPAFAAEYARIRESNKPSSEPAPLPDEVKKAYKEQLTTMEDLLKNKDYTSMMSQDDLAKMNKSLDDMRQMVADADNPTPNKSKWERNYPADVQMVVKKKLQEYLDLSATVDFNAELTTNQYNKKIFVKKEYEYKPAAWKACFRAGKEVNEAVRTFVTQWQRELSKN